MARSGWPKFLENMSCSFYIILSLKNRHFWTLSGLGSPPAQNDIRNRTSPRRKHEENTKRPRSAHDQNASGRFRTLQNASPPSERSDLKGVIAPQRHPTWALTTLGDVGAQRGQLFWFALWALNSFPCRHRFTEVSLRSRVGLSIHG